MLEAAADELEGIPACVADEPIFSDPNAVRIWRKLAKAVALQQEPVLLGRGTRGAALDIGNGRVLKITDDRSEAVASANVRDKPDPDRRVADIFKVMWLRGKEVSGFAIVQEKLDPLGEDDASWVVFADLWPAWSRAREHAPIKPGQIGHFLKDCEKAQFVKADDPQWKLFSAWFMGLAQYLESAGVSYHDFWRKNLLKRGNDYVVIDLGYSQSEETDVAIDVIAKFKAMAAAEASSGSGQSSSPPR